MLAHIAAATTKGSPGQAVPTTDHRPESADQPGRRPQRNESSFALEEPERRRLLYGPSTAARAAAAYREATRPRITPATARRYMERYRRLLGQQVSGNRGKMSLDREEREVLVRKFGDLSMTAERADGAPKVLTRVNDKEKALDILAGIESAAATSDGRTG